MDRIRNTRDFKTLALIVLAGAVIRVVFAALPRVVRWDEAAYLLIARNLLASQGYAELWKTPDIQQPPVVAYLSLVGEGLRLPWAWAAAIPAHVLLGGLPPLPVYGLGRELYGRRVGLIAALLVAVHPALAVSPLYWSTMTEPPYLFFALGGIYSAWRIAQGGRWLWWIGMGGCLGLAYLTRPEAMAYFALLLLFVIVWQMRTAGWRGWVGMGACLAVFVLVAAPYVIYLHQATGHWAFSGKQGVTMEIAAAYVNHDQAAHDRAVASLDSSGHEIAWLSREKFDYGLIQYIMANPRRFVRQVRLNMVETWRVLFHQDLLSPWIVGLVALGLFARPWTRSRAEGEVFLFLALVPLTSLWAFFVLSRFLVMAVIVALIWAAAGVDHLAGWAEESAHHLVGPLHRAVAIGIRTLPLAMTIVTLLWAGADVARREQPQQPYLHVAAGQWLAAHVPAGSILMARDSEIALYAGLPLVAFPNAGWDDVLAYGRARGARYLVVNDWEITRLRPQLSFLLDPAQVPPELEYVVTLQDHASAW